MSVIKSSTTTILCVHRIMMAGMLGASEISSGYNVNGTDYNYPYDGDTYDYSAISIGMKMDNFLIGLGAVNYDGYAKYCNRAEIQLGLAF